MFGGVGSCRGAMLMVLVSRKATRHARVGAVRARVAPSLRDPSFVLSITAPAIRLYLRRLHTGTNGCIHQSCLTPTTLTAHPETARPKDSLPQPTTLASELDPAVTPPTSPGNLHDGRLSSCYSFSITSYTTPILHSRPSPPSPICTFLSSFPHS
jgi:hypothetical protein